MKLPRRFWGLALALLCALLCGCDDTVRGKLSETQANEMIATLAQYRISATRQSDPDGTWHVSVHSSQRELAAEILKTYEMPQAIHPSMSEVFPKEGFMSSPVEERARYQYGLAQELAQTIERMEGVVLGPCACCGAESGVLQGHRRKAGIGIGLRQVSK
jgi:type III secretion protein J